MVVYTIKRDDEDFAAAAASRRNEEMQNKGTMLSWAAICRHPNAGERSWSLARILAVLEGYLNTLLAYAFRPTYTITTANYHQGKWQGPCNPHVLLAVWLTPYLL